MINCPNCGAAVASNQRFCGSCGTDVQAAMSSRGAPVADNVQSPYAYAQPVYDYNQGYAEPSRGPMRLIIIIAVLALVSCCMFACGILIGIEIPDILGLFGVTGASAAPKPTPRFTPTPQSMMMAYYYLIG